MAPHHYDLIKENDEAKDEPQTPIGNDSDVVVIRTPVFPKWYKLLLFMILATCAGLGAAFGVVFASSFLHHGSSAAATVTATAAAASSSPTSALPLSSSTTVVDSVKDKVVNDSDPLEGKILDCGWSFEEAKAKDCVYDVMMQDWVPAPCYDSVLTEKYLSKGNYTWYADIEGNVMSDEEMRKGEHHEAWMTGQYHKAHCIFSWEKLIRAMRNNQPISQELMSYDHVLHCEMQTLGEDEHMHKRDAIGVRAPTNYAKCALYSTWKSDLIPDKHSSIEK